MNRQVHGACRHRGSPRAGAVVNTVRFDLVESEDGLSERVADFISCRHAHVVHFFAVHPTTLARQNAGYRRLLNDGDLNLPDGAPIVWALRLFGHRALRATGTDSMHRLCEWSLHAGARHFLYGGTPELLTRLRERLESSYPGIRIVGAIAPPFGHMTAEQVASHARAIGRSRADLVWIGLGTPKQDMVAEELRRHACAPVLLCVGAAFDYVGGVRRRAPRVLRRLGLEWVYRLLVEPRRLWRRYLLGNPQFVAGVLLDRMRMTPRVGDIPVSRGRSPA